MPDYTPRDERQLKYYNNPKIDALILNLGSEAKHVINLLTTAPSDALFKALFGDFSGSLKRLENIDSIEDLIRFELTSRYGVDNKYIDDTLNMLQSSHGDRFSRYKCKKCGKDLSKIVALKFNVDSVLAGVLQVTCPFCKTKQEMKL